MVFLYLRWQRRRVARVRERALQAHKERETQKRAREGGVEREIDRVVEKSSVPLSPVKPDF
jgi:hypothetical protein